MDWKEAKLPIAVALPGLLIQVGGIGALLYLTYGDLPLSLFATILSLIWLQATRPGSGEQIGEWRARRELFGRLGEWLGRDEPRKEFDQALTQAQLVDEGSAIDDPIYRGSVLGQAAIGSIRGALAVLLNVYLVALVVWTASEHLP